MLESGGREKADHDHQKTLSDVEYLIDKLTEPGALVVDPYCGSGTVPAACKNSAAGGSPARSNRRPHGQHGGEWPDAAADPAISQRTTQPLKRFLYGIRAGRRIDPGGYSVGGTIPDSWLPQVCRVGRTKTAIHHSARSKPVRRSRRLCRLSGFDRPSPILFPHNRHNMNDREPRRNDRSDLLRGNRGFATVQTGATVRQDRPRGHGRIACTALLLNQAKQRRARRNGKNGNRGEHGLSTVGPSDSPVNPMACVPATVSPAECGSTLDAPY